MAVQIEVGDFSPAYLVDSSRDSVLTFDRRFRHTVWNQAMERIAGGEAQR